MGKGGEGRGSGEWRRQEGKWEVRGSGAGKWEGAAGEVGKGVGGKGREGKWGRGREAAGG